MCEYIYSCNYLSLNIRSDVLATEKSSIYMPTVYVKSVKVIKLMWQWWFAWTYNADQWVIGVDPLGWNQQPKHDPDEVIIISDGYTVDY